MFLFDYLFYKTYSLFGRARDINRDGSVTSAGLSGLVTGLIGVHTSLYIIGIISTFPIWQVPKRPYLLIFSLAFTSLMVCFVIIREWDERAMLRFRNEKASYHVLGSIGVVIFYAGGWLVYLFS